MPNQKGLVLTITIIFVLILVIMAGVSLILMTNHARITESQIKRTKAFYVAEAAKEKANDELETNKCDGGTCSLPRTPGNFTTTINGLSVTVTSEAKGTGSCPSNAPSEYCIKATATY